MSKPLASDAVFVISGAASGLGKHLTQSAINRGYRVLACDIAHQTLDQLSVDLHWPFERVRTRMLDVRDPVQWNAVLLNAVNTFGRVDVLLNVAGVLNSYAAELEPIESINAHLDINVKGVIFGTQAAVRHMLVQESGCIINIASLAGVGPIAGMAVYSASKYAVRGYSLAAALEFKPRGIDVIAVCPDSIQTPMLDRQKSNPNAAMMFSGSSALSVNDVEHAIFERALKKRPYEVRLPFGRSILARSADRWPGLAQRLLPGFWRRGQDKQRSV